MSAFIIKPVLLYCCLLTGTTPVNSVYFNAHPLHVSTTDISYNAKESKIEVIGTQYTDDFEAALEKQFHTPIDLQKPAMHNAMDALVKNYYNSHVKVKCQAAVPLTYVGFEINREAVNVYLESDKLPAPKRVEAEVSLLHNVYTDQLNIVHITVNGNRKSTKIDYPDIKVVQAF